MATFAARTTVPADKTRSEIERTLTRYGAKAFAYGWKEDKAVISFDTKKWRVRFELPLPKVDDFVKSRRGTRSPQERNDAHTQAVNQRWRALLLVIKAKLEAVDSGIRSFEQEFLTDIVVPATNVTVGEWLTPQLQTAYETGKLPDLLPGLPEQKALGS